jgi:hypothetical protein
MDKVNSELRQLFKKDWIRFQDFGSKTGRSLGYGLDWFSKVLKRKKLIDTGFLSFWFLQGLDNVLQTVLVFYGYRTDSINQLLIQTYNKSLSTAIA